VNRVDKINDLITTIVDVFTFAGAVDKVSKIEMYQNVIDKLWRQTYECGLFIQEYFGHGFTRKCPGHPPSIYFCWTDPLSLQAEL
jgi:hypothetical protein